MTGARLGTVSRIDGSGNVYVELADVAPGFEFGPCIDAVGDLTKGDRVVAQGLARDADELVITGIVGGPGSDTSMIPLNRLPVAPSGNANPTQIVRADDARLSDPRTPTTHTHVVGDLPVASSGSSSSSQLVRADDVRLALTASGSLTVTSPTTFIDVTFPVSRFSSAPKLLTSVETAGANVAIVANHLTPTASGVRIFLYGLGGTWTAGSIVVNWLAVVAH